MILPRSLLFALPLALSACAATAQVTAPPGEVASSDAYRQVPAPDQTYASPLGIAQALTGGYPAAAEVSPVIEVRIDAHPDKDGRAIVTASVGPLLDDSVKAEEWVAIVVPEGRAWRIETLGVRLKCWRGTNPDEWTTKLCP